MCATPDSQLTCCCRALMLGFRYRSSPCAKVSAFMSQTLSIDVADSTPESTGTLVIYSGAGPKLSGEALAVWAKTGLDFESIAKGLGFSGKAGHAIDIISPQGLKCDRLLVLGNGDMTAGTPMTAWLDRGGSLMSKLNGSKSSAISIVLDEPGLSPEAVAEMVAGIRLRHYKFDKYRTRRSEGTEGEVPAVAVTLCMTSKAGIQAAIADRMAAVEGTVLARNLVNEPANVLGPVEFAGIASRLSDFGVDVEVLTPEEMAERGMNALLAVGQGSDRPSRLVVMQWNGGKKGEPPLAFVGKGVVFDTGGISIKPAGSMEDMKGDMGGAAAVTGLMRALAVRKAKANVVGVIGLVENMPDGKATRPGDILTAMSGTTIEVVNTDAEGRLVLADALWYTQERFKPKILVDLATLTGAILVALAHDHAGLFSNNDDLAAKLFAAGQASGEKVWRLPLGNAYEKLIESRFADIKNSGGRHAGSITAAHFLQHFVNNVPWAHLDIAGTAFGAPSSETNNSWGTGFGVALLDRFVRDNYEG
jgi:leucyl aminopeptidase